ncbi:hypothetical protein NHX12_010174 [Muraenolepis orangiensis]|uniref:Putative monooxygenase p33MONOX n=1 Tax=Muraenolepis orangiensis TaxID=630683 RepID=A0A9Q0I862_9TELE|nr:hypothetical protein NHX12_010174 [Muraenolepis orangiensis]
MSGSGDVPGLGLPLGMARRALSYDDNLEAPMSTPPHDISINNLWRRPLIPERKFTHLAQGDDSSGACVGRSSGAVIAPTRGPVVVKTKASSIIIKSLITNTSYTPHKGLTAEETRHHHRMPESFHKLQIQSMESREDSSTQSWFSSTGSELSVGSNTSVDLRWSAFGPRPSAQKSNSDLGSEPTLKAGFALQAYRGAHKPTAMEVMKAQATRLAEDTAAPKVSPPKMEIPAMEGRSRAAKPHKLKPRDMNVLTPSGF